jgi:hypothetical protein
MLQAQVEALVRRKIQAVTQGAVNLSTMFDLLEVVTIDQIPGGTVSGTGTIGDRQGLRWRHAYEGNLSAGSYSPGGARPAAGSEKYVELSAPFGKYTAAFELTHLQWVQLLNGQADEYVIDNALARQQKAMIEALVGQVETDIMSGVGLDRVIGLSSLITDVGVVYNQPIALYPTLAAYRNTAMGPRALDAAILRDVFSTMRNTFKAFKAPRLFAWCPTAQKNAAEGLPSTSTPTSVISDGGMPTRQLSVGRVFFDKAEFIDVPGATAGTIYLTEEDSHKLVTLPDESGSMFHVMPPQRDGDIYRFEIYCYIQQWIGSKSAFIDQLS